MAPKRKITVDLPNSRKSRDRNDRVDRPSNDLKNRHSNRSMEKERSERNDRNIAPDRSEDLNRSGDRERTGNKPNSSGNTSIGIPASDRAGSQRDSERDRGGDTQHRASVFSRLGKGPLSASSVSKASASQQKGICRPWAETGQCPYGNECRFKHVASLVSPSKRPGTCHEGRETKDKERDGDSRVPTQRDEASERQDNNRERNRQTASDREQGRTSGHQSTKESVGKDPSSGNKHLLGKRGLASKIGGKTTTDSPRIDPNWENWDEDNLDYDDELMLEKKRQLLQRELEKQMAVDGGATVDPSAIAPGSSTKGLKANLPSTKSSIAGPDQSLPTHGNKVGNKRALGGKSSSSSSSSSSTSDSGSSSASSSSSDSSDDSDGAHNKDNPKKKNKNPPPKSLKRSLGSNSVALSGLKSSSGGTSSLANSRHRNRSGRASSASSSEKRKRKDRTSKSSKVGSKKSRTSIGEGKNSSGSKRTGLHKRDKRRTDRKSKNVSSKSIENKRDDQRTKSPSRHGKTDKRSLSSDRHGVGNQNSSRNRRASHSPLPGNATKKRRSSGAQSEERPRDYKHDKDRFGLNRENKNSYTSATGMGSTGRDRDLRRSEHGHTLAGSTTRDFAGRDDKLEPRNRDFQRSNNDRFEQKSKFGRDASKERNKDQWSGNNRNDDSRNNERGNSGFEQRRDGPNSIDRDRRGSDRASTQKEAEKNRAGFDRTPPLGFRNQREEWNRSPVGDRNRDNWDDGGNTWNRDKGLTPVDRRGRQRPGHNNAVLSGANSVPVKAEQNQGTQRRAKSPFTGRERSGRSRSKERLLPPHALNRSTGNIGENRDYNREDRRSAQERDRSPRLDRNRSTGDQFDRRRSSPRDSSRGSADRLTHKRDRERVGDTFENRNSEKERRKNSVGSSMDSRMDRSRSRDARAVDKFSEDNNFKSSRGVDEGSANDIFPSLSSDKIQKYSEVSKVATQSSSPICKPSISPSRRNSEKQISGNTKVGTNETHLENGADIGSNQMGTEEYSDFDSDSGEEWLNDMRGEDEETEDTLNSANDREKDKNSDIHTQADDKECDSQEEETPTEECDNNISEKRRRRNSKHDGLLEGISDEDLDDVSDEESGDRKGQSAKLADALGVDWNQLVELKQKQKTLGGEEGHNQESNNEANDKQAQSLARKKRWTPIAIFNRIGLPKSYLSDSFYNSFVQKLNDNAQDGEKLELLHDNAGQHMRLKELRERRKSLFINGPYSRPMLARQEIAIRRELCGLPNEDFCEVPLRPNTDMELWNKAVQLLRGSDTNSSAVLSESNTCIKTTPVHG